MALHEKDERASLVALAFSNGVALSSAAVFAYLLRRAVKERDAFRDLAAADPDTGLYNKKAFQEKVVSEIALAGGGDGRQSPERRQDRRQSPERRQDRRQSPERRQGQERRQRTQSRSGFAILLLDVRKFKRINDLCGHATGDEVIRAIADVLTRSVRAYDFVARLGRGDEFGVVLVDLPADLSAEQVASVSRAIATGVRATRPDLNLPDGPLDVTIGVAVYPRDGTTYEQLYAAADHDLYLKRGLR